jgi:hypothetical protein
MTWSAPSPSDLNRKAMPRTPRNRQIAYVVAILAGTLLYAFVISPALGR